MDLSLLLLRLLRAAAWANGDGRRHGLTLDLEGALRAGAGFAPPELRAAVAALVADGAAGRLSAGATLAGARALAGALGDAAGRDGARLGGLAALGAAADAVAALCGGAGPEGPLAHATVDLAASPLGALVSQWRLAATPESPETIIAHLPPEAAGPVDVRPRGKSYVERRVAVRYQAPSPYPHLLLAAPSRSPRDGAPDVRPSWHQRPLPDYDLAIFSEQERAKGGVATRRLQGRVIARGAALTLVLDAPAGHGLISTEFLDETDRPLARILRWPPVAA